VEIRGATKQAFQQAWLVAAKADLRDPIRSAELARVLTRKLPVGAQRILDRDRDRKRYKAFLARVAALAARSCDAETALALVAVLAAAPLRVYAPAMVYGPVIELLANIEAPAAIAPLEELVARPTADTATVRDYLAEALPPVIARLAKHGRPARAPKKRKVEPSKDLEALYTEILATPDDDAPRMVYADALLEQGDPRGAFIQAQLAAPSDLEAGASIVRKYEKLWLGDVSRISKNRIWRRGFLDEMQLLQGAAADANTWKRVTTNPALATLRTLHKEAANEDLYGTFVGSSTLAQLRNLDVPTIRFARQLDRAGLAHLELGFRIGASAFASVDELVKRLGVTRLAIETAEDVERSLELVERWPGHTRLTELTLVPVPRIWQAWRARSQLWLAESHRLGIARLGAFDYHARVFSS
jgi:uncharacterized protein (TIGR02996 family)